MAIQWGGNSTLRIGLDVFTDGYDTNTPSINIYIDVYVGSDNYNYSDNQHIDLSGSGVGQGFDFNNSLPRSPGATQYVGRAVVAGQGQNYNGGPYYQWHAQLSGAFNGQAPSVDVGFTLPARPPNYPLPPPVGVDSITSTSARIVVYAADGRGAGVDAYQVAVSQANADFSTWSQSFAGGTGYATNLQPYTFYNAAARAHNGVGWSDWAYTGNFRTGGTIPNAPGNVVVSAITQTSAHISWSAPSYDGGVAVTRYDVQLATDSGFTSIVATPSVGNTLVYDFTTLTSNSGYFVRTRAVNSLGPSAWTAGAQFRTLMTTGVNAPAGAQSPFQTLQMIGSDANDASVKSRSWTQTSGTPTVSLTTPTGQSTTFYAPGTLNGASLGFRYSVTDIYNTVVSTNVVVTIRKAAHRAVVSGSEVPMDFRRS